MTGTVDTRRCTRTRCLDQAQTLKDVVDALGPALRPGCDPAAALYSVVHKATQLLRQRNAYGAALRRVHTLWQESQTKAGIVLADDLRAAMYIGEDEIR